MSTKILLDESATCSKCGFATRDLNLLGNHSCATQEHDGKCEDYPCCGHERGDCNGLLYGSDQAIQADPHLLCDHNTGYCEIWDREQEDAEDEEDEYDYQTLYAHREADMI